MELKVDLKEVERAARESWEVNLRFRRWMRNKSFAEVQAAVDHIGRWVSSQIDCTKCANCCRALTIVPKSQDVKRLSDGLGIDPFEFKSKYLKRDHEGDLVIKQRPCPFLKGSVCSVYESRPETCRSYPHLESSHMAGRGWHIVENTLICPIVYNTYELLKDHFGYVDGVDVSY